MARPLEKLFLTIAIVGAALAGCDDTGPGTDPDVPDASSNGGPDAIVQTPPVDAGPGPGIVTIRLDPARAQLETDGITPARQAFRVIGTDSNGDESDVTSQASLTVADPGLLRIENNEVVTRGRGGSTTLRAIVNVFTIDAQIDVRVTQTSTAGVPGATPIPSDAATRIDNATDDPARAPEIVYPNAGVVIPPNLGTLEIHYLPGDRTNELFRLNFTHPVADVAVITRCVNVARGCVFTLDAARFTAIAGSAAGSDPINLTITGAAEDGSLKGTSTNLQINVAARPVAGAIYYWTTTNGGAIMRSQFGSTAPPERFFPFTGNTCHGCHALSPNGQRMSISVGGNNRADLGVIDVAARDVLLEPSAAEQDQFYAWDPSSERFAAIYSPQARVDTNIRIRDGNSGLVTETIDVGVEPDHPDWSPRGDRIIFTEVGFHFSSQFPGRGGISYIELQQDGNWSMPMRLIPPMDGLNRYYPAYSPDASFFLYNESTCPNGQVGSQLCDADSDPSAKLFAMVSDGGAAIELSNANQPGIMDNNNTDLTNSYPKWAPFVDQRRNSGAERVMWMTFSSRRNYGLRRPAGTGTLLWMAAIDPDAVVAGRDGSSVAFALPFQDLTTSNHIAQWVAAIVPDTGNPSGCLNFGDPCDPNDDQCCAGSSCSDQGGEIFRCKPSL